LTATDGKNTKHVASFPRPQGTGCAFFIEEKDSVVIKLMITDEKNTIHLASLPQPQVTGFAFFNARKSKSGAITLTAPVYKKCATRRSLPQPQGAGTRARVLPFSRWQLLPT